MHYFSTNKIAPHATFREAVLKGQPEDKGLYFPERIPQFSDEFLRSFHEKQNVEIAVEVIRPYAGDSIGDTDLHRICDETLSFDFPLVQVSDRIFALELFHGPTMAFKDVGARFMSRCLRQFAEETGNKTIVIVATSGDTGGAVAAGFQGVENVEVVILYPKDKVSRVQELQLTTPGGNITALKVNGNFDDCQAIAKEALADDDLKASAQITSANSINIARWLSQQFYYVIGLKQWSGDPPVISVPSGNFGNICAGLLAHASGLPVDHFIAACNVNDTVPRFFTSGQLYPRPTVATLSNAMDVSSPSNFVRVLQIFKNNIPKLRELMSAASITDEETASAVKNVYEETGYVLDPHAAVAYHALDDYLSRNKNSAGIFLATAHPVKFESVHRMIGTYGDIPASLDELHHLSENVTEIEPDYDRVKEIITAL